VVDFDGDCLSGSSAKAFDALFPSLIDFATDVFFVCGSGRKYYQIWINNKSDGFKLAQSAAFPPNVGAVSFADMGG
jgi:hypothetical protein